jgi:hypothetical protein
MCLQPCRVPQPGLLISWGHQLAGHHCCGQSQCRNSSGLHVRTIAWGLILHLSAGPLPDKEPQQAAGPADASDSPAAAAADSQPMALSQPAEVAGADAQAPEAVAPASSADEAADATPMSQLPDAADMEEVGQGLDLVPAAHSAAQELLDTGVDADDGFHLEDFQVRFGTPTYYV